MTGADKLIGGNSNITLYYFHGRANVVNLMWLAYVKSIRILLSRWPIKMYFTELLDRCKADIWRHAGCNFGKQEWYYLLRYGTGVIIMASKPTKTVRHQKFLTEYTAKWDFIVPSVKGETYARCNSCNSDFSIKSSGAYDINIHIESAKHKSSAEARASNHAITSFFASEKDDFSVIRAETLWTQFVVDHNMPFTTSDAFTDVVKQMFPDSKVASKFQCQKKCNRIQTKSEHWSTFSKPNK